MQYTDYIVYSKASEESCSMAHTLLVLFCKILSDSYDLPESDLRKLRGGNEILVYNVQRASFYNEREYTTRNGKTRRCIGKVHFSNLMYKDTFIIRKISELPRFARIFVSRFLRRN